MCESGLRARGESDLCACVSLLAWMSLLPFTFHMAAMNSCYVFAGLRCFEQFASVLQHITRVLCMRSSGMFFPWNLSKNKGVRGVRLCCEDTHTHKHTDTHVFASIHCWLS